MILGFKKTFPWKEPTWFREKILIGVNRPEIKIYTFIDGNGIEVIPFGNGGTRKYKVWESSKNGFIHVKDLILHPKIHTMRADKHNRWKSGRSIQMVYRGPKYSIESHFNKGIERLEKCVSEQKIEMKFGSKMEKLTIHIDDKLFAVIPCATNVHVNEPFLSNGILFARNDGFDNVHDFVRWFAWKDFTGKVIHWSNFKY